MKKLRRGRKAGIVLAKKAGMKGMDSRFHADKVERLVTVTAQRRFEMQFSDSNGKTHVVSLPLPDAIQLGWLICDVSETAPYLLGGTRTRSQSKK